MIRCLIVDDEPIAIRVLSNLLGRVAEVEVVATCTNAFEALNVVKTAAIDLVFLDIEMPELSGVEFVVSLADPPRFIFTTAHRNYAVRGFELDAVDYLLKPISPPRLLRALEKYHRLARGGGDPPRPAEVPNEPLIISVDRRTMRLDPSEIRYIESLSDYVLIHTDGKRHTARLRISDLEEQLAPHGFIRIHRSYLIPARRVDSFTSTEVQLGPSVLPVSRTYRQQVLERLRGT